MPKLIIDGDSLIYKGTGAAQRTSYRIYFDDGEKVEVKYKKEAGAVLKTSGKAGKLKKVTHYKSENLAKWYTKKALNTILDRFPDCEWELWLSPEDHSNFRYRVAKTLPYKGNRPPKPKYYKACRDYLTELTSPKMISGSEADDVISVKGWMAWRKGTYKDYLLVHIDKDINQVPGCHYNPNKDLYYEINEEQGIVNLCKQMVLGDTTDNIPGLKYWCKKRSLGPTKVDREFDKLEDRNFMSLVNLCKNLYVKNLINPSEEDLFEERFAEQYKLLKLLDTKEELLKCEGEYKCLERCNEQEQEALGQNQDTGLSSEAA